MATNDYWIDIIPPKNAYGSKVGLDTYDINPHLGGHHHGHGYGGRRQGLPLFYTVDYGTTPVIVDRDDYEIPDNISGPMQSMLGAVSLPNYRNRGDRMKPGDVLRKGESLRTSNGGVLCLQEDGNFVLYAPGPKGYTVLWASNTPNSPVTKAVYQRDGNFYLTDDKGRQYYSANSKGSTKFVFQTDGNAVWSNNAGTPIAYTVTGNWHPNPNFMPKKHSLFGDIVHAANNAASFAGKALALPGQLVSKIPIVGKPLRAALNLNPVTAMGGLVASVAHGERLDKALLDTAKHQIASVREIAPYAKMVVSLVPGVGSGVAAAMAAGVALSEGRTITDAVKEAVISAVPGGDIGRAIANASVAIASGGNVGTAAMNAAIAQLPPAAQHAAQSAIAVAKGQNVKAAVLNAVRASLPPEAQKAVDIGTAIAVGRNVQSAVVKELTNPKTLSLLTKIPIPPQLAKAIPKAAEAAEGYKAAIGLLQHSGVTAHGIAAVRETLPAAKQAGFDHGVKTYMHQFTRDTHSSLVRGGVVTRGNWRAARAGEKGIPGRLIKGNKVTHGSYVRV